MYVHEFHSLLFQGLKKARFSGPPLPMALVMDLPHQEGSISKCIYFVLQYKVKSTAIVHNAKYLHMQSTELCLASSKILTPLHPASVSSPRTKGGEGGGGSIFLEDARHRTGLLQYNLSTVQKITRQDIVQRTVEIKTAIGYIKHIYLRITRLSTALKINKILFFMYVRNKKTNQIVKHKNIIHDLD